MRTVSDSEGKMTWFLRSLFGFEQPATTAERYFFAVFEGFVAVFTLKYAWTWAIYVQQVSDVVLPLGIANYVDVSVLFQSWTAYGVAGLLSLAVLLGWTRTWRYGYVVALLLLHLLFTARYSQGEIPHSSNVLGMTLLGLGLGLAAFDRERFRRRFTLGFAYFSIGIGYTSAAVCKLIGTGPHWVDGHHLQIWVYEKSVDVFAATGTFDFTFAQSLVLEYYWVATLFLVVGFVSESLAFLMWWPRFRIPVVLAVLGLHAGIYATMQIVFSVTTVELILLALPWACIAERIVARAGAGTECPLPHFRSPESREAGEGEAPPAPPQEQEDRPLQPA
jgi:hypothetical protein